jgi:MFS family permease
MAAAPAPDPAPTPHRPYAALGSRNFRFFAAGRFIGSLGDQMLGVAVGWELYARTHSALALGLIGLVQIVPVVLLSLPAGNVADRVNRRHVMIGAQGLILAGVLGLAILSALQGPLPLYYGCLLLIGVGSAFRSPAASALISQTVPSALYANAATWSSSSLQLAAVLGPSLAGLAIAIAAGSSTPVYILDAAAGLSYMLLIWLIRIEHVVRPVTVSRWRMVADGISFVARTRVILGAMTLDMFGVLLGGATTLMPIYARDILHVGAQGLGWLVAAPSVGAISMAVVLAHLPPFKRAGATLLVAVVGFGAATIVFGISTSFPLSLAMLALLGAFDNISMVIRHTLLLVRTPDELRGRVSAVNNIFIGASNQLGGFESGLAAAVFTPAIAVVGGGVGTIVVVLLIALAFPQLRRFGGLVDIESERSAAQRSTVR